MIEIKDFRKNKSIESKEYFLWEDIQSSTLNLISVYTTLEEAKKKAESLDAIDKKYMITFLDEKYETKR